jgi:hydroxymethylglutaryl-CoA lyase
MTVARPVVTVVEVGARDGLQNEKDVIGTADKGALLLKLIEAGARRLEVASFGDRASIRFSAAVAVGLPEGVRRTGLKPRVE